MSNEEKTIKENVINYEKKIIQKIIIEIDEIIEDNLHIERCDGIYEAEVYNNGAFEIPIELFKARYYLVNLYNKYYTK